MQHELIRKINVYMTNIDFPSFFCIKNIARRTILDNKGETILVASVYYGKTDYLDCVMVDDEIRFVGGSEFTASEEFDVPAFNKSIEKAAVIRLPHIDRGLNVISFANLKINDVFDFNGILYTKKSNCHAENEQRNAIDFESHHRVLQVKKPVG